MIINTNLDKNWLVYKDGELPSAKNSVTVPTTVAEVLNFTTETEEHLRDDIWYFEKEIDIPNINKNQNLKLVFEGLASFSEIYINNELILETSNMFLKYQINIDSKFYNQKIVLKIKFKSLNSQLAVKRLRGKWMPTLSVEANMRFLRTSLVGSIQPWTVKFIPIGIYRPVYLQVNENVIFENILIRPKVLNDKFFLDVNILMNPIASSLPDQIIINLNNEVYVIDVNNQLNILKTIEVSACELWQVHTHGKPRRHPLEVSYKLKDRVFKIECRNVGFKNAKFSKNLNLILNDQNVFCRGVVHSILNSISFQNNEIEIRKYLSSLVSAGCNLIRISGTMTYESDLFYDLCDECGILIWHDLMLANMHYPFKDQDFNSNLQNELTYQLSRLSRFVSVTFICGGSEVYQQAAMLGIDEQFWQKENYEIEFKRLVENLINDVFYFPNSPCFGAMPFHVSTGIAHYYGVGAYNQPLEAVKNSQVKFATESLGFSNLPDDISLKKSYGANNFPKAIDPNWMAGVAKDFTASWNFEDTRNHYFQELFKVEPKTLRETNPRKYFEISKIVPGIVMQSVFSYWRSLESKCGGGLVWFSKDLRNGGGFGIFDSYNRVKPVFYYLKRVWQPLSLQIIDNTLDGLEILITNEKNIKLNGVLKLDVYNDFKTLVFSNSVPLKIQGNENIISLNSDKFLNLFTDITYSYKFGPSKHNVVHVSFISDTDKTIVLDNFYFPDLTLIKTIELKKEYFRLIKITELEFELEIKSDVFVQNLYFESEGLSPSDNYFHLAPNFVKKITISKDHSIKKDVVIVLKALNASNSIMVSL